MRYGPTGRCVPRRLVRDTFCACSGEGYALACEALAAADLRPLAPRIAAPTLVVCGSEESDAFKDAARWLGEYIAGARVSSWSGRRTPRCWNSRWRSRGCCGCFCGRVSASGPSAVADFAVIASKAKQSPSRYARRLPSRCAPRNDREIRTVRHPIARAGS
jgi:hypothetical protein